MALIKLAETGFYRIPLTVALSDSTHGEIKAFELLTFRDSDGAEGVGYTYTAAIGRKSGSDSDIAKLTRLTPNGHKAIASDNAPHPTPITNSQRIPSRPTFSLIPKQPRPDLPSWACRTFDPLHCEGKYAELAWLLPEGRRSP